MTVQEIIQGVIHKTGLSQLPHSRTCDHLITGSPDTEVTGIVTTFMATVDVIRRALGDELHPQMLEDHLDAKSRLQEVLQREGEMPVYVFVSMEGPPHAPVFRYSVTLNGQEIGTGDGTSKQNAQQEAARDALRRMRSGK